MAALRIVAESLCNSAVDSYSEVLPLVLPKNRIQFFTHRKTLTAPSTQFVANAWRRLQSSIWRSCSFTESANTFAIWH